MKPPTCKLCGDRHWLDEGHGTGSEEVRELGASVLRNTVTKQPETVTKRNNVTQSDEIGASPVHVKKAMPTDGGAQPGRPKKYANHAARQRAYRERK